MLNISDTYLCLIYNNLSFEKVIFLLSEGKHTDINLYYFFLVARLS